MKLRMGLIALVIMAVMAIAACGGGAATPATAPPPTQVSQAAQGGPQPTETVSLPTSTASIPTPTESTIATAASPGPTLGVFAISPEATRVPILPTLLRLRPVEVLPGAETEIEGFGGHIELRTADGSRVGYIESSTDFPLFLDNESIGTINCYVNTCLGTVTLPVGTLPGSHQISVEGGSSLAITVLEGPGLPGESGPLTFTSSAFSESGPIPLLYSCDGEDVSPALIWSGVPEGTETLVVIMDDLDASGGTWDHWVVFNIPADAGGLEAAQPDTDQLPIGGLHGENSWGDKEYGGPCPPRGPAHNYRFFLYAVDVTLGLQVGASKKDVLAGIEGHIVAESILAGTFER